jgi:glycosyltransferase involved in cell wall biosynthesis
MNLHARQTPPLHHPRQGGLRVGMIFLTDPESPTQLSGMPYRMAAALREQGVEIVPLRAGDPVKRGLSARLANRVRRESKRTVPVPLRAGFDALFAERARRSILARASRLSARVHAQLDAHDLDLLFGVCISTALYNLDTRLPIVYFSDATSRIINTTYPLAIARGRVQHAALEHVERASLARVTRAAFASPRTRDSAVEHLGFDATRARVLPMGAHITPSDPATVHAPADHPTARECRLLIIAADPLRKRVDLAVRATETLRARGIHATLSVIGPGTRLSRRSEAVESVGPLRLNHPEDAQRHRELLRACHIQLLPSLGEAFGIAPAESAHFARPSIVSDTGGLPFVVLDDRTGMVLPVAADHRAWADAVGGLVRDPERYRRYSTEALVRAREELNWSAWAARVVGLMREATGRDAPACGPVALAG